MKNQINYIPRLILIVVLLLLGFSFVPRFEWEGFSFRQINILSSIVDNDFFEWQTSSRDPLISTDTLYLSEQEVELPEQPELHELPENQPQEEVHTVATTTDSVALAQAQREREDRERRFILSEISKVEVENKGGGGEVLMEDFSQDDNYLAQLRAKLRSGSPLNIAIMGDSYLEGDIIAKDIRSSLHTSYGGGGVGFMPITATTPLFRRTIRHSFSDNWTTRSIVNHSKDSLYLLSGNTFHPQEEAWVEYQMVKGDDSQLNQIERATLLLINPAQAQIQISINGAEPQTYTPQSSHRLQELTIENPAIKSIRYKFSQCQELVVYGAILEDREGVNLDNYYVRGNKGVTMTAINHSLTQEYTAQRPYSMIIMEYGLNVSTDQNVAILRTYIQNMYEVVRHIQSCYPQVPIIIMGVGERLTQESGELESMKSVIVLDHLQRELARQCGTIYWSTRDAILSQGGLERFVKNGWAAKDYTHLSARGGEVIAQEFIKALELLL